VVVLPGAVARPHHQRPVKVTPTDAARMLRPLSARSVVASTLLGTHPPSLPGRLLVALGERFGISAGTTRVALSRMIDRGELVNADGVYMLTGPLLRRQARQDASRIRPPQGEWDGTWEQAVIVGSGRSAVERSQLRRNLTALGLGEWREGVWMRPANLDVDDQAAARADVDRHVMWFRVMALTPDEAAEISSIVFDLEAWATDAKALEYALVSARARLSTDDSGLVDGFMLSAAALRHFTHDPRLPVELQPPDWPAASLHQAFDAYHADYQTLLGDFFRAQRPSTRVN